MTGRRIAALLAIVIGSVASIVPVAAMAQTDEAAAERAAREIQEARNQANEAAEAFFQAESDLDVLRDEVAGLERETDQLQTIVDRLRRDVESVAVSRFISSGASGIPLLTGIQAPQDQVQAEVFVDVLTNSGADVLDAYDIAQKQLVASQSELADRKRDIEAQQAVFVALQEQAEDEVARLRAFEEERLQDEAVQRALATRIAADRVQLEEQARREAEAAARAIPDPVVGLPTTTLVAPSPTVPGASATNDAGVDAEVDGVTTTPAETAPSTTEVPTNEGASGGTSGGRTGAGGSGSNARPIDTGAGYLDNIICPMPGSAFADTWGAPRSGGRSHQGVDMIAPRGIPIYAVTSGFATFKTNRLGGNAASLLGDNGNRYYYAHLDSYVGESRIVFQGDVIGYNGDTGNARFSTPHLHFEIRPGGGLPTNPYPTVRAAGC
ncbi:peptidoglycan DD-metalloendopeptidase family protein [uncultured Ilumatobacter sp.]|uniref:peptidoglycan DD-metalloendopeptidase family protein n=1 Tax=uncultured Ilumatobacter sp. TaxID=879968 RepID=UPI00374F7406